MQLTIQRRTALDNISALSGVVCWQGLIYLIGDDSTTLYKLKDNLDIHTRVVLYGEADQTLVKKEKADLECMSFLSINSYPHLLVQGSGSKSPKRDVGFLVKLPTAYNRNHLVWKLDLQSFYSFLRSNDEITTNELNIEGLSIGPKYTFLANRGNKSGAVNAVLSFSTPEYIEFIQGHTEGVPFPAVHPVALPDVKGVQACFTGLDECEGQLFFTASAENSSNAYDDGAVTGSLIGTLKVHETQQRGTKLSVTLDQVSALPEPGLKIESLSVFEKNDRTYRALAVTDSDGGASELLLLEIQV
ncbi:MAG: hypothetical protein MUF42_01040 [Cytophagaceae bacterium]|jgi:hypothetical protein|nr:hypothetical protein [Cytophagaceae bacterium]